MLSNQLYPLDKTNIGKISKYYSIHGDSANHVCLHSVHAILVLICKQWTQSKCLADCVISFVVGAVWTHEECVENHYYCVLSSKKENEGSWEKKRYSELGCKSRREEGFARQKWHLPVVRCSIGQDHACWHILSFETLATRSCALCLLSCIYLSCTRYTLGS